MSRLEERAERIKREAQARVVRLTEALRAEGWHFVAIQLAMVIAEGEDCACPGASMLDADADEIGPALPREADSLRHLAKQVDEAFARLGCHEATEGYREEVQTHLPHDRRRK